MVLSLPKVFYDIRRYNKILLFPTNISRGPEYRYLVKTTAVNIEAAGMHGITKVAWVSDNSV